MTTPEAVADAIEAGFTEQGLRYDRIEDFDKPLLALNFGGGDFSYNHVRINVFVDNDAESIQIVTSPIASVPAEKTAQMLICLNENNRRFRWVHFYLDDDNDLIAESDAIIDINTAGPVVAELVGRTASIIDDAYADFMKAIWA